MKTLLLTMLLMASGTAQIPSKALSFKRSVTAVFSFTNSGSLVLKNTPVLEKSATPIASHGLVISKNTSNKLWTKSDSVNISGNLLTVSSEPGLRFHNNSKNTTVLLSDSGNLVVANDDANLTHDDLYLDNHVIETDFENNVKKEYCGFGDGRIEYDSSGTSDRFYLKDHLGSTRAVIDGDGALIEVVSYDAYGAIIRSEILAGSETPTKEKFTGKEYDTSGFIAGGNRLRVAVGLFRGEVL